MLISPIFRPPAPAGELSVSQAASFPHSSLYLLLHHKPQAVAGPSNLCTKDRGYTRSLIRCSSMKHGSDASLMESHTLNLVKRRNVIGLFVGLPWLLIDPHNADATGLPPKAKQKSKLIDDALEKDLENVSMVATESGLHYIDIEVGEGPSPPVGFQVAANYVAMVPSGHIVDSSLEKGQPYTFRVGSGQVIKGLDEGILSMKVGGKRRLYIPGSLAFPEGLTSAPGRARVAPNSPVILDVNLDYIAGL